MIRINLLPQEERVQKRRLVLPGVGRGGPVRHPALFIGAIVAVTAMERSRIAGLKKDIARAGRKPAALQIERVNEPTRQREELTPPAGHPGPDRALHSVRLMDEINHDVPGYLWLTALKDQNSRRSRWKGHLLQPGGRPDDAPDPSQLFRTSTWWSPRRGPSRAGRSQVHRHRRRHSGAAERAHWQRRVATLWIWRRTMDIKDPRAQKMVLMGIVMAGIGYLYFFATFVPFGYRAMAAEKKELQASYEQLSSDLNKARQTLSSKARVEKEFEAIRRRYEAARVLLPEEKEVANLLRMVSLVGQQSGVEFELFRPTPPVDKSYYVENPVEVQVYRRLSRGGRRFWPKWPTSRASSRSQPELAGIDQPEK
jgi:Tfp pilus assembly protein PilN